MAGSKPKRLVSNILSGGVTPGEVLQVLAPNLTTPQHSEPIKLISAGDVGALVKNVRKARGLSQQDFSDLAGIGRRFLSELENGKPTLEFDKVLRAANAAGVDLFAHRRS